MIKKLLAITAVVASSFVARAAYAFSPVQYVQISTNSLSQQSGNINIQGAVISTATISSATIAGASITTATVTAAIISSSTLTNFTSTSSTQTLINATTITVTTITPTGIVGTTTNNNANIGNYGEYVSSVSVGNTAAATTNQYGNIISMSLTAGDWDVTGSFQSDPNGATVSENFIAISINSGNTTTDQVVGQNQFEWPPCTSANDASLTVPRYRLSLSAPTTIFLKGKWVYTVATPRAVGGSLLARRMR